MTSFRALLFSGRWSRSLISGCKTRPASYQRLGPRQLPSLCSPASPGVSLQVSSTVVLPAEHKGSAVPKEPKVTVEESRFIECFQQLHWLRCGQGGQHPSGKFQLFLFRRDIRDGRQTLDMVPGLARMNNFCFCCLRFF